MVLKKVKWTYFDAYLCQTMWNNAKKSMKRLKRPNSLFLQGEVSSAVLKTWKTRETKTRITQNFQILNHIQGTTIEKLTSWGFRKCGSFCPGEFLKRSYWLSKSSNFSFFFWKFYLTLTANNSPLKSRTPKKYHIFGILRMWGLRWWYPGYGIVFENFE